MVIVSAQTLENKVSELNEWLANHHQYDHLYNQKRQSRDYYVDKLCEMADLGLTTIELYKK